MRNDTGMVIMATQRQSEFDLHARTILGLPVSTAFDKTGASAVILDGIDAKEIQYTGLEQAIIDPDVDVRLFAKPEAFVARRMGVAVATASTVDEAKAKTVKTANLINVNQ